MFIEKEIKEYAKNTRLKQLKMRYFDLEMDRVSLEYIGDKEAVAQIKQRMEDVKKAYKAVEALDIDQKE
ncbi:MAG TPA: hypothetical protein DCY27_10650 [Desulfobacterales bacterium]|nr:hypothetical protein [Desulfobacterales bacterium]